MRDGKRRFCGPWIGPNTKLEQSRYYNKMKINSLDSTAREAARQSLQSGTFDVLVIGGGITGVGIALDCASRGLKTALVEMQDYGAGTSSRSTKLIHGGLRYLKQLEFKLVAEVGRERAIIHRNAPHVVIPEGMLLPVVQGGTYGKLGVSVGLWVYDALAGVRKEERRIMLSRDEALDTEPLLRTQGLKGAGLYSEYRTDDARLTIEVAKTAVAQGAVCLNYTRAVNLVYDQGRVRGAEVEDQLSGERYAIRATEVVNAAGPWVDEVRELDKSLFGKRLRHTKGVHLVVPFERLPLKHSVYFDIPDGRMMFAIPRDKTTYLGTTDTFYSTDPVAPYTTREDAEYLLDATNAMFPEAKLGLEDVRSTWAGIRPLIHEDGKSPSELSRKDEIIHSRSKLITIAGGKLTGFRKMAQRVSDLVMERLIDAGEKINRTDCLTDKIPLSGGDLGGKNLDAWAAATAAETGVDAETVRYLAGLYGSNTLKIIAEAHDHSPEGLFQSAVRYSVREEGNCNVGDFIIRRTGMLYFERDRIPEVLPLIEAEMTALLGKAALQSPEFDREYEAVVAFREGISPRLAQV